MTIVFQKNSGEKQHSRSKSTDKTVKKYLQYSCSTQLLTVMHKGVTRVLASPPPYDFKSSDCLNMTIHTPSTYLSLS